MWQPSRKPDRGAGGCGVNQAAHDAAAGASGRVLPEQGCRGHTGRRARGRLVAWPRERMRARTRGGEVRAGWRRRFGRARHATRRAAERVSVASVRCPAVPRPAVRRGGGLGTWGHDRGGADGDRGAAATGGRHGNAPGGSRVVCTTRLSRPAPDVRSVNARAPAGKLHGKSRRTRTRTPTAGRPLATALGGRTTAKGPGDDESGGPGRESVPTSSTDRGARTRGDHDRYPRFGRPTPVGGRTRQPLRRLARDRASRSRGAAHGWSDHLPARYPAGGAGHDAHPVLRRVARLHRVGAPPRQGSSRWAYGAPTGATDSAAKSTDRSHLTPATNSRRPPQPRVRWTARRNGRPSVDGRCASPRRRCRRYPHFPGREAGPARPYRSRLPSATETQGDESNPHSRDPRSRDAQHRQTRADGLSDQRLGRPGEPGKDGADGEGGDREHVRAPGAEPAYRPRGRRNDGARACVDPSQPVGW